MKCLCLWLSSFNPSHRLLVSSSPETVTATGPVHPTSTHRTTKHPQNISSLAGWVKILHTEHRSDPWKRTGMLEFEPDEATATTYNDKHKK